MPATVRSAAIVGVDAVPADVEVEELRGLPRAGLDASMRIQYAVREP